MLETGTRLGHYEILEPIGKGGMGEVYRARDTKLERDVAIKVLPQAVATDQELLARLEREAKVLASVNHPNIAAIYGLETSGDTRALVLELIEGPTLADRIGEGPIPFEEALSITLQIAEALRAAHARGVVHRDLKPANIKLTADGQVKVLDFGLAKVFGAGHSAPELSDSPTLTKGTAHGVILGTAAYMSPEQARGKPVDKRTDIWAFGVVLCEMLTGDRLFTGETVSDVLAAVLTREPELTNLPATTPDSIRRLLHRCLKKDSNHRLHDIADARLELEDAKTEPSSVPEVSNRTRVLGWVAAGILTCALALVVGLRPDHKGPEMRVEINTPPTTDPISLAISPDGRAITFVASTDDVPELWIRPLQTGEARPLPETAGASYPFWSPNSRRIGFFADGQLKQINLDNENVFTLAPARVGRGGAWGAGGKILFAPSSAGPLSVTSLDGSGPVVLTTLDAASHRFPHFLPGERDFLLYATLPKGAGVFVGSVDDGRIRHLVDADTNAIFSSRHLLFVRQGGLWAQPFDPVGLSLGGGPVLVTDDVMWDADRNVSSVSVSSDGKIVYRTGAMEERQLVWHDRSGAQVGVVSSPDLAVPWDVNLGVNDRRVATRRNVDGKNPDIWLIETERGVRSRFTFDDAVDAWPVWSPDGRWVAFASRRNGTSNNLYRRPANGSGSAELLLQSPSTGLPVDWSPDGRFLVYQHYPGDNNVDLWALALDNVRDPFPLAATPFLERHGQVSAAGEWLAYTSNESGRHEIVVQAFPESDGKWQVSTDGGSYPRWRRDGRELFYLGPEAELIAVPVTALGGDSIDFGSPEMLFSVNIAGGGSGGNQSHQYDVSSDGKRFLINTVVSSAGAPITLILNWQPPSTTP